LIDPDVIAGEARGEFDNVVERGFLGFGQVVDDGAGGAEGGVDVLEAEAFEGGYAEVFAEGLFGLVGIEQVGGAAGDGCFGQELSAVAVAS